MRPLSGAGRLALAVPQARVIAARVVGAVDIARFPHRPRIVVEFFEPAAGQPAEGESAVAADQARHAGDPRAGAVPSRRSGGSPS